MNRVNRDSVILEEILQSEEISLGKSIYDSFQKNRSVLLDDYMLKLFINADDEQIAAFEDFVIDLASAVLTKGKAIWQEQEFGGKQQTSTFRGKNIQKYQSQLWKLHQNIS